MGVLKTAAGIAGMTAAVSFARGDDDTAMIAAGVALVLSAVDAVTPRPAPGVVYVSRPYDYTMF